MKDLPFHWPDSRQCETNPARLPACFRSSVPISGMKARIAAATMLPRPGIEHRISRLRALDLSLGDTLRDLVVQLGDLPLDQSKAGFGLAFENRVGLNMAAVAQPGALLCQGRSCDLQVPKIM
jgi:hypothetical protein